MLLVAGLLFTACAVPVRYVVPGHQLAGLQVFGKSLLLAEPGGATEDKTIIGIESSDGTVTLEAADPNAHDQLQRLVAAQPREEVILTTSDTRLWPSILGGAVGAQIGYVIALIFAVGANDGPGGMRDEDGQRFLIGMAYGLGIGTLAGVGVGSILAGRIKYREILATAAVTGKMPPVAKPVPSFGPTPPPSLPPAIGAAADPTAPVLQPPPAAP